MEPLELYVEPEPTGRALPSLVRSPQPRYLQSALVLQHPADAAALGAGIADKVRNLTPTVVLRRRLAASHRHEVARSLGVRAIFAERAGGSDLTLRRGFALSPEDRVLVVEDVFTTGKSTRETIDVARSAGATVVGAAAIVDRSGGAIDFGVPSHTLVQLLVPTYGPDKCPLCAKGIAVEKPGSRPT